MIIHDRSYPHPVLSPFRDDVIPNHFDLSLTVESDADAYYLGATFSYDNSTIAASVAGGGACFALHVECRRNFFRHLYRLDSATEQVRVDARQLAGRVQVSGFVLAAREMMSYTVVGAHPDYDGAIFSLAPGDVMAVARTVEFDAHLDYDPLARISSILTIARSETQESGPMVLDFHGDLIVATLSQADYGQYVDLKGDPSITGLLANQVVVPSLIEALHEIRASGEDERELEMDKRWFRSIVKKMEELGIDLYSTDTSVWQVVQALLRQPLRRSLSGLIAVTADEGDQ